MDASGAGALQQLFTAPFPGLSCISAPNWTAEGTAVVFALWKDDAGRQDWRGRIHVVAGGGGTAYQFIPDVVAPTNPAYSDRDPAWSR